jgi:UDP-N-acetylglucosamine enolpyruvyl transferase
MSFLSKLIKAGIDTLEIPVAVIKDVATLGGAVNDGYFRNRGYTYTGKKLKEIGEDIEEAKDEL